MKKEIEKEDVTTKAKTDITKNAISSYAFDGLSISKERLASPTRPDDISLIEDHLNHSPIDCHAFLGNPGVGDKFNTLSPDEQVRIQNIVDAVRIHLAVLEEQAKSQARTIDKCYSGIKEGMDHTDKSIRSLELKNCKEMKNIEEKLSRSINSNSECLASVKESTRKIETSLASIKTTQKIIWWIISVTTVIAAGEAVALIMYIIRSLMEGGFN